ncbi:MAG TPA: permease [Mesotoga sp.]|nr:permease [Mesotoga sp.]
MKYLDCGFEYIISLIEPITPIGREALRNLTFLTNRKSIEEIHRRQEEILKKEEIVPSLKRTLSRIRDVRGTISNLSGGNLLEDIELFEIKSFTYWCEKLREELGTCGSWMQLPCLSPVFSILDPDNSQTESFYISNNFDDALGEVRKELHRLQRIGGEHTKSLDELVQKNFEIERRVRADLSDRLREYRDVLEEAINKTGNIDLVIALTDLNKKLGLRKPEISSGEYEFEDLFNPEISESLRKKGKEFQPFSANFGRKVVIVGGNMTGKSVLLRSVALLQTMFQYGLFVPANKAFIPVYESVVYFSGDKQSFTDGLSSFAGEIQHLKEAIEIVQAEIAGLFLFDEIGRSTNPVEGPAFLIASADYLGRNPKCRSIFTSHYEEALQINSAQLFMIKGVDHHRIETERDREISYYVDHSLIEMRDKVIFPKEAIAIARIMGLDKEFIELIKGSIVGGCE